MKSFDTEIKKYTEKIRMTAREKRELRERVSAYMEYHPLSKRVQLREAAPAVSQALGIESQPYFTLSFSNLYVRVFAGAFLLLLVVGVPIAAERALPGDALYLVKTEINEGIRSQFAATPYDKVALETKFIERRVAEARLLASEGKLTDEVQAEIAETVKEHADAAKSGIEELRVENAEDAAIAEITFDSALQVQSAVLDTDEETGSTSDNTALLDAVNTVREQVVANRGTSTPSYDKLLASVETETTRAYELFETVKVQATSKEITDIERRLGDIDRKIVGARTKHNLGVEGAIPDLTSALGLTHKLIAFMTDIDVRQSVALETLVPVELTLDEQRALVRTAMSEIEGAYTIVVKKAALIEEMGQKEKVVLGLEEVSMRMQAVASMLDLPDVDMRAVGVLIQEAKALTDDLVNLTSGIILNDVSEEATPPEEEAEGGTETVTDETAPPTDGETEQGGMVN